MRKSVLWGHHYNEYCDMFNLTPHDACSAILEYGCGPSALNCERTESNQQVISIDPLFKLPHQDLKKTVLTQFEKRAARILNHPELFDFSQYGGAEVTIARRRAGIETFLADYEKGLAQGRYQSNPDTLLNFEPFQFDLALSSHYFFSDDEPDSLAFELNLIKSLTRTAKEVRIFPLINKNGQPSKLLGPMILELMNANYGVEVKTVSYHVQPKGNAMLRVWPQTCERVS